MTSNVSTGRSRRVTAKPRHPGGRPPPSRRGCAEQREGARDEAERLVAEAHEEARRITFAATTERERLQTDVRRLREQLRTALASLEELDGADEVAAA
jgi:hypothetical protein